MESLKNKLKNYWPILILIGIEIVVFFANYTPHTFVVGWDNMYPEFNFVLNIKRSLTSVWQEYRGLGLEDGLSHAAQLPHYLFLWLLSLFLPQQLLRYAFIFLMHLVGGIGMHRLLTSLKEPRSKTIPLLGALFYQYNLATVQMFYLPFEVFMVHYAFLPWLVWAVMQYLSGGTKKYLAWLCILSLISTPQAHVPTVFLVYLMVLGFIVLTHLIAHRSIVACKRIGMVLFVTFLINAFWGLPFAHNTLFHANDIANSKNNQIATNDIFLKNQRYGNLTDTALMRSFSLDYVQYDHTTRTQEYMFTPWKNHIDTPMAAAIAGLFFGLVCIGLVLMLRSKRKDLMIYVVLFLFTFFVIGNDIPFISVFSKTLREQIPLFHNVFRFVFTKFFTLYAFAYTILITFALFEILHATSHARKRDTIIGFCVLTGLLLWYTLPSFQGNFIYKNLRVAIPKDYTDTFAFFDKQSSSGRIAVLPAPWFWAWTQYDWGVIGSGFQWFGIQQPLIDRAFDPWSRMNENFYWELSQAIYTKNTQHIQSVFLKYDVQWILLDEHIVNGSDSRALYVDTIRDWLISDTVTSKAFQSGKISIYAIHQPQPDTSFISVQKDMKNVGPVSLWNDQDAAYLQHGPYKTDPTIPYDVSYPFRSLFSGRSQSDVEFTVENQNNTFIVKGGSRSTSSAQLLPDTLVYDSQQSTDLQQPARSCDGYNTGFFTHTYIDKPEQFERFTSTNSSNCIALDLPTLSHRVGYIVGIEHRPVEGKVFSFSVTNKDSRRSFIETVLTPKKERAKGDTSFETAWIVIPALEPYGLGYTITLDNISIGRQRSVNDIRRIRIYTLPYEEMVQAHDGMIASPSAQNRSEVYVSHPNPAFYTVTPQATGTLVLSQSYDDGWVAFDLSKKQFLKHVLVSNWKNGWELPSNEVTNNQLTIYIFFWPQILEWIGFLLLPIPFLFLLPASPAGRR